VDIISKAKLKSIPVLDSIRYLNGVLGLSTGATAVCAIGVARELDNVRLLQAEHILEPRTDGLQHLLALSGGTGTLVAGDALADSSCPQTNTVETLANVDNHTHHLVITVGLEGLADGGKLRVQPEFIDRDGALVLELV